MSHHEAWRSILPPGFSWPAGVRAAACFTFDLDAESPILFDHPETARYLDVMTHQAYGPRTAVPRILRLLDRQGIRATFFVPGYTAVRYPDVIRAIVDAGHEIAHHGYLHEPMFGLTEDQESAILDRGLEALDAVAGVRPTGYRAPMWELNWHSPKLLRDRGFLYDSSLMDTDHPYDLAVDGGGPLVEIPIQWALDDWEQYCYVPDFSGSGLIWYGGLLGGVVTVLAWARWRDFLRLALLDMSGIALALGYAVGRLGCQVSGDGDYGKVSGLPWAMPYAHGAVPTAPGVTVKPTPLYETLSMGLLALVLWRLGGNVWDVSSVATREVAAASQLLLVQSWVPDERVYLGINAPAWSISTEMFFYAVFPFVVSAALWMAVTIAAALVSCWILVQLLDVRRMPCSANSSSAAVATWSKSASSPTAGAASRKSVIGDTGTMLLYFLQSN